MTYFAHETAVIDAGCSIGEGTKIWHFSHIMPNCTIGEACNIGQNVVVSPGVILGKNVKIPKWLCLSVGYGADGMMAKFANPYPTYQDKPFPYFDRYQQYYLSVDIDFNKIPTRSRLLKKLFQQLNLLKIPAPTLEWNQIQGLKFRPLYF